MSTLEPAVPVSREEIRARRAGRPSSRPWLTPLDLFYLGYLGPLRVVARLMPARLFLRLTRPLAPAYARARPGLVSVVEAAMGTGLPECEASHVRSLALENVQRFATRALDDLVLERRIGSLDDVSIEGEEIWRDALAQGKGMLLFSGHSYASRVARGHLAEACDLRIKVVRRGLPPPRSVGRLGRRWLQPAYDRMLSRSYGDEILLRDRKGAPLQLLRELRRNGVIYSNLDAIDSRDVWKARFLNHYRLFPGGLLDLARVTGAPLVPISWTGDTSRLRVRFHERVRLEDATDRSEFVAHNLPLLVARLEETIRADPAHWEGWGEFEKMRAV